MCGMFKREDGRKKWEGNLVSSGIKWYRLANYDFGQEKYGKLFGSKEKSD